MVATPADGWPDYPFASHYFTTPQGHRLHYVDTGAPDESGPLSDVPVICVHGNPTWSFYFRSVIKALQPTRRVLASDHIGMGLSDRPKDQYTYSLDERIADLTAWLAEVVPEGPVDLVLHDWGGMIGGSWAVEHATRVRRWAVHNTAIFGMPPGKPIMWQLRLCRLPFLGPILVRGFNGFSRYAVNHCSTTGLATAVADAYLLPYADWTNRLAVLRFVQDIPLAPGHRSWPQVEHTTEQAPLALQEQPLLVVWGQKDFVFDDDFLSTWQEKFPHAVVQTWRDAGHYLLEDQPEAAERIASFLSE
jgi:haloalkane dehalogenase